MIPGNDGNYNNTDAAMIASASLTHELINQGSYYDASSLSPKLYMTTLAWIFLIHAMFLHQWLKMKTRKDVAVTYQNIFVKKQFYKLVPAMLSHPPSAGIVRGAIETSRHDHQTADHNGNQTSRAPFDIEFGDQYTNESDQQHGSQLKLLGRFLYMKIKNEIIKLSKGNLSGLPLLAYISHILWQCRALEEIYDYTVDIQSPNILNTHFNISTIIERDTIIQKSMSGKVLPKSTRRISQYSFEYHRVLLALIFTSYMLDFLVTYLILRFAQKHGDRLSSTVKTLMESQSRREICTLTPLCIAVIVIYTSHFPHTPISVIPFIDTGSLLGRSSDLTFILAYLILTLLSQKSYPFMGMLYGSLTGLLWTNEFIHFLADKYWGRSYTLIFTFACFASLKAKTTTYRNGERRRLNNFLFWLDYVSWESDDSLSS